MSERRRSIVDVHLILFRDDGRILLMRRANTGYGAIWTGRGAA